MSLQVLYSQEDDIVFLGTSEIGDGSYEVESHLWAVVTLLLGDGYKPVALDIMFASDLMPLETNGGYCSETDTLVIGKGVDTATLIEENSDLTSYWSTDDEPDDLSLVAVSLRNASKHLAPVVASLAEKEL